MTERPTRVLVVGGGAAGAIAAATLLRDVPDPLDVRIVERRDVVGPGLAYRTTEPLHLLNNYAGRMSAFEDDPEDLVRWCTSGGLGVTPDTFLPRHVYGRYLAGLVARADARPGSRVSRLRGEVVSLEEGPAGYAAGLASGGRTAADVVVLALGNPPPRDLPGYREQAAAYAADPWAADLAERVGPGSRVLLVGSGLTAVDVAAQVADVHHDVELVAVSRHAMLPRRHQEHPPSASPAHPAAGRSLAGVLAEVRHRGAELERAGGDWRELVESVKAGLNDTWSGLADVDRERFLRHVARHWEVARHRMAPAVATVVEGLLLDGRLRVATPDAVDVSAFDLVVNCTGPAPACTPGWNPLVDSLAARGLLRPGPLGLGLDVTGSGRLIGHDGVPARGLYVLGAARRGVEWEVAAVPDIRRQVATLAAHLARPAARRVEELVG
jgi:uncharacterized NAD(P)/FAD-binding protein YdhS